MQVIVGLFWHFLVSIHLINLSKFKGVDDGIVKQLVLIVTPFIPLDHKDTLRPMTP